MKDLISIDPQTGVISTSLKTKFGKPVVVGKFYELMYRFSATYNYGYGWINPKNEFFKMGYIDIICHHGGVTHQKIENVVFVKQIKQ